MRLIRLEVRRSDVPCGRKIHIDRLVDGADHRLKRHHAGLAHSGANAAAHMQSIATPARHIEGGREPLDGLDPDRRGKRRPDLVAGLKFDVPPRFRDVVQPGHGAPGAFCGSHDADLRGLRPARNATFTP